MKRIIISLIVVFAVAVMVSACANQHKCPAYGHYTEVQTSVDDNTLVAR